MKKRLAIAMFMLSLVTFVPMVPEAKAAEVSSTAEVTVTMENGSIMPQADVIEVKYRVHDGRLQYRRWNATRGYWVDSTWKYA